MLDQAAGAQVLDQVEAKVEDQVAGAQVVVNQVARTHVRFVR